MKISVLTDESGRILATQYDAALVPLPPQSLSRSTTLIKPSEGQSLHEVEVPEELEAHVLQRTLATEIPKYSVQIDGKRRKLVKISGRKA